MLTVEIKWCSHKSGVEIVDYLELKNDGSGDGEIGNYLVCHYARDGVQRALVASATIKGHRRHLGARALVRRAFNELALAEQPKQQKELVE